MIRLFVIVHALLFAIAVFSQLPSSAARDQGGSNGCAERSIANHLCNGCLEAIATTPDSRIVGNPEVIRKHLGTSRPQVIPLTCSSALEFW